MFVYGVAMSLAGLLLGSLLYHFPEGSYVAAFREPYVEDPSLTEKGVRSRRRRGAIAAALGVPGLALGLVGPEFSALGSVLVAGGVGVLAFPDAVGPLLEEFYIPASTWLGVFLGVSLFVLGLVFA